MTDAAVLQIQKYYGLAIKRNCSTSVHEMYESIWAEFYHLMSSNEDPKHGLCPDDDTTWCKYRLALKQKEYDHNQHFHLPADVMNFIKPIFKDLSDKSLLEKCLKGKTQNLIESFNNIIWTHIPKAVFVGLRTLKLGVDMAVCSFNDGGVGLCKIVQTCGLKLGNHLISTIERFDRLRIRKSEKALDELEKKIRQHQNLMKRKLEDKFEEEEGDKPSYAPGQY